MQLIIFFYETIASIDVVLGRPESMFTQIVSDNNHSILCNAPEYHCIKNGRDSFLLKRIYIILFFLSTQLDHIFLVSLSF